MTPPATKPAARARRPARPPFTVFLDRDGVLNAYRWPGPMRPSQFRWIPGAREAVARLNRPDVRLCLVTNQPLVGLCLLSPRRLAAVHAHMLEDLRQAGGRLDRIEYAASPWPHRRRKPQPGMLESGGAALGTDKGRAILVGDKARDVEAARRYGIPAIRVGPHGEAPDLGHAVERILAML